MYRNHYTNPTQILFITIKEYYENKYFCDFLYSLIKTISTKQQYMITAHIPKLLEKKIHFFSLQSIRMSGNSIIFNNKKIKKVTYTITKTKKYLIRMILMLIKY